MLRRTSGAGPSTRLGLAPSFADASEDKQGRRGGFNHGLTLISADFSAGFVCSASTGLKASFRRRCLRRPQGHFMPISKVSRKSVRINWGAALVGGESDCVLRVEAKTGKRREKGW